MIGPDMRRGEGGEETWPHQCLRQTIELLSKEFTSFFPSFRSSRPKDHGGDDAHATPGAQEPGLQPAVEDRQHLGSGIDNFLVSKSRSQVAERGGTNFTTGRFLTMASAYKGVYILECSFTLLIFYVVAPLELDR